MQLAIELGGTKLQAAVGTAEGKILRLARADSPAGQGAPAVRDRTAELVREVQVAGESIDAVGIGFGGPVVRETGRIVRSHQVSGWEDFDLRGWAQGTFGVPAVVENDANCGAVAEARLGAGRGVRRVLYMNIGSGIGGGFVLDGRLASGPLGGEIGHSWVWDASAGAYDKLENLCSGWSIARRAARLAADDPDGRILALADGQIETIDARTVATAAGEGDPAACTLLDDVSESLAVALANAAAMVQPETLVIGGGVAQMGDVLFDRLRARFECRLFAPLAGRCRIVPAELLEENVLVGALLLHPDA
ncbi:MAG TPA: ROK family protein [Phycisphaerae bacterium]|nr:ROK family protein [Phycisphaerae bacterium]